MPRGSTTTKRQQLAANQRERRHENCPVSPTKPIRKPKSNGHFINHSNGHVKTLKSYSSTPSPPATPPPLPLTTFGYGHYAALGNNKIDIKVGSDMARKPSVSSSDCSSNCSSDCSSEAYQNTSEMLMHGNHRQIDVNATKNPAVHQDLGPLSLIVTVLRSCPLSDTLAILIVLLQIPPTFLSIIQLLFATLTFVPSSSVALSGLSYMDLLQVTLGTPSLTIIFFLDLAVILLWLFLRSPIQDVVLDLAQIVIALTLGGGTNGKGAGIKNIFWCLGILVASHVVRAINVKNLGLRVLIPSNFSITPDADDPLEPATRGHRKRLGLVRSILAIHILTQGVVRYIRDWYVRREKRDITSCILDAEAGKAAIDTNSDVTSSLTGQSESPTSAAAGNVSSASKKKKKHCAQVRVRQPLWSALASTKIVMVKEYESSHTAAESAGTNATDMNNLGNAPFHSEADRIWITYVGSDEIFFSTGFFPTHTTEDAESTLDHSNVDMSKPFYVRVNNTIWQPTKIYPITDPDQPTGPNTKWTGEIFGLAPTSSYHCDFISTVNKSLLFSTSIRTLPSPTADLGLTSSTKAGGRPSSPYTTLKASIAQAGKKLDEERQRQKSSRKEFRAKLNSMRREFERLVGNIASTGGNDDKLRQKAQQSALHMKQADEAAAILVSQIETIDNIPTDETSYSKCRSEIQSQREKHRNFRSEFNSSQQNAERDIQTLKADLSGLQQKLESRKQRLKILNTKHESIADANAKGLDEVQRRKSERDLKRKERANIQAFYSERLHSIIIQIYEGQSALHVVGAVIDTLMQAQQGMYQNHSTTPSSHNLNGISNLIPEHPSGYPWNTPASSPNVFSSCTYSPMLSTTLPTYKSGYRTRGRSSSMLSNVSKFTQSSEEGTLLSVAGKKIRAWDDTLEDSKYSSGSPSGTGSGAGSVGDPKSPLVVNDKVTSKGR